MIGGSGSINAMVYLRGFPRDYNSWEAMGNIDWGYDKVEKAYNRMENNMAWNISDFRSTSDDGPLKLDYFYNSGHLRNVFIDGLEEMGYWWAKDFNGDDRLGFSSSQGNLYRGIRQSSARAYLIPAARRMNLHVVKMATVTTLTMSGNLVTGVNYRKGYKDYQARVSKEVILSGGAIGSPQILMSSGIGPKTHLDDVGINLVKDLPVGMNLQDHTMITMFLKFDRVDGQVSYSEMLDNIFAYFKNRTGPYSAPTNDFNVFINTKDINADHPDIQGQHLIFERNNPTLRMSLHHRRLKKKFIDQLMEINSRMTIAIVQVFLTNPKSQGKIQLKNNDPLSRPLIFPNFFSEPEDMDAIIRGLKFYDLLLETRAMKENGASLIHFENFECEDEVYPSDAYWECYARQFSRTASHPAGTTRMGPAGDPKAVVDPVLRVHGVQGLRVCDAGIQPNVVTVNINPSCMMIGERCAEFIEEEYEEH